MQTTEGLIRTEGFYITAAQGASMLPFIRPKVDTVVLGKVSEDCAPMDVVLYRSPEGRLVLHRVIRMQKCRYLICGDNTTVLEYIEKDRVIAKLIKAYHGEKEIKLNSMIYRFYVLVWCRPYHMRMMLLRIRNRLGRITRKIWHKSS